MIHDDDDNDRILMIINYITIFLITIVLTRVGFLAADAIWEFITRDNTQCYKEKVND